MESNRHLLRFMGELAGITTIAGTLTTIGAWHYFGSFAEPGATAGMKFSLAALALSTVPMQGYLAYRILPMIQRTARLQKMAREDHITGLLNQTAFRSNFNMEVSRLGRHGDDRVATFMIVSLDHFKRIHDTLGHSAGDRALRLAAAMLSDVAGPENLVGRLGGEEFGVFLRDADFNKAREIAERLRQRAETLVVGPTNAARHLSVSIGGVSFANPLPFETLFAASDVNLFRAKQTGKDRCILTNAVRASRRPGDNRGATRMLAGNSNGIDGSILKRAAPAVQTPVEPKPAVPRAVKPSSATSMKLAS